MSVSSLSIRISNYVGKRNESESRYCNIGEIRASYRADAVECSAESAAAAVVCTAAAATVAVDCAPFPFEAFDISRMAAALLSVAPPLPTGRCCTCCLEGCCC